jgi:hypothetical protein
VSAAAVAFVASADVLILAVTLIARLRLELERRPRLGLLQNLGDRRLLSLSMPRLGVVFSGRYLDAYPAVGRVDVLAGLPRTGQVAFVVTK